jgi:hypothetical protein
LIGVFIAPNSAPITSWGQEMVHVVAALDRAPFGIVLQQLDIEPVRRLVARMSKELSRTCLTVVMPASGRKKPKWSGNSA